VSLRCDFIATARAALDARKPVQRPRASARDFSDVDDVSPTLDPYAGIGAWR
jgi:hypothetical protein